MIKYDWKSNASTCLSFQNGLIQAQQTFELSLLFWTVRGWHYSFEEIGDQGIHNQEFIEE